LKPTLERAKAIAAAKLAQKRAEEENMRNTAQYPVTADEVLGVLEKIPQDNPPGTARSAMKIGGINDMIRRNIIEHFNKPEHMNALLHQIGSPE
jgi:hypothetical protein